MLLNKRFYFVKRFIINPKSKKQSFITEHKDSVLEIVSTDYRPQAELVFVKEKGKERKKTIINLEEFINIKGINALGNKLSNNKIKEINLLEPLPFKETKEIMKTDEAIPPQKDENDNSQIRLDL